MGKAWLTVLDTQDIEILSDSIGAAASKLHRAHPEENEMWNEFMDLCADLHASWEVVFPLERLRELRNGTP